MFNHAVYEETMKIHIIVIVSCYLAQNAAIWLTDEVLGYRDYDTSRCQDDISWHLIYNNWKDVTQTMVCILMQETVNTPTCLFERKQCKYYSMFFEEFV